MRGNRNAGGCPSDGGMGETKSPIERYDLMFLKHFYREPVYQVHLTKKSLDIFFIGIMKRFSGTILHLKNNLDIPDGSATALHRQTGNYPKKQYGTGLLKNQKQSVCTSETRFFV
jgi:hypothetical protein